MSIRAVLTIAGIILSSCVCNAQKWAFRSHVEKYSSPDGAMVVTIRSSDMLEASDESRIEIRTKNGRLLAKRNYSSEDGEHGYGVTKAIWTPDSQFFVYSLESSGGHQAWNSPIDFFVRKENRFVNLDNKLNDAVMNPDFSVSTPDRVTVELWFSRQTKTVSLGKIGKR